MVGDGGEFVDDPGSCGLSRRRRAFSLLPLAVCSGRRLDDTVEDVRGETWGGQSLIQPPTKAPGTRADIPSAVSSATIWFMIFLSCLYCIALSRSSGGRVRRSWEYVFEKCIAVVRKVRIDAGTRSLS